MRKEGDAGSRKNTKCGGCFEKRLCHLAVGRTGPKALRMDSCEGRSVYRSRAGWVLGNSKV